MNETNKNNSTLSASNLEQTSCNESMGAHETSENDTRACIHIHSKRHRLCDPDGISGKAAIDGLVHAKVLSDDSANEVKEVTYSQEKIKKSDQEETIITIEWPEI